MNNFPQTSDIILQIFVAFLTLITSLITAYFDYKMSQEKKSKGNTKLGIIKAAANEIRKYSQQTKSIGENKDLLEYIIYKLPIKVNELAIDKNKIQASQNSLVNKVKIFVALNVCILFLQILFYYILDVQPIYSISGFSIISILICLAIVLEAFILVPYYKSIRAYKKKAKSFIDELDKMEGTKTINSISREKLTEFIRQRNKFGFGTSLNNVKEELESYGIKVPDSENIRSHLNFFFFDDPEGRRDILFSFYLDGKTRESFDELSDKEILHFFETLKNNIGSKPKAVRSYLNLYYSDPEERREILDIYFMDEKVHESFDEVSDEEILSFIETTKRNFEYLKTKKDI